MAIVDRTEEEYWRQWLKQLHPDELAALRRALRVRPVKRAFKALRPT